MRRALRVTAVLAAVAVSAALAVGCGSSGASASTPSTVSSSSGTTVAATAAVITSEANNSSTSVGATICNQGFRITKPSVHFVKVGHESGLQLAGTACPGQQLFFFDKTGGESTYHFDDARVANKNGAWKFSDRPIGDDGDGAGTRVTIYVVAGPAKCSAALPGGDDRSTLPASCSGYVQTRTVELR